MDVDLNMTVSYTPTSWVDGSTGLSAARLNNIESAIGTMAGSINRAATFVVAANNSSTADKNVADYQCTGTNDDVTINNAITAAAAIGGGVVQLCTGLYTLANAIQMKSNVWLRGSGVLATILYIAANVASTRQVIINNTGGSIQTIAISDMTVDGNKSNNTQTTHGIYLVSTNYSRIDNVEARFMKNGLGIYLDNACNDVSITRCLALSCDQDGIQINGTRCRVMGCYSSGAGTAYPGISSYGANNIIANNNCTGNGQGILLQNATAINNVVNGNVCELNTQSGIYLANTGGYNVVTGNHVHDNGQTGIMVFGTSNSIINNNLVWANSTSSNTGFPNIMVYGGVGTSNYNTLQENLVRAGANANKPNYGIMVYDSASTGNLVTNNDLHAAGVQGNYTDAGTGTVTTAGNRTT